MRTLKELRESAGLSVKRVAERLNIHKNSINDWENGKHKPHPKMFAKLAKLYECKPDEIFNAVGKKVADDYIVSRKEGEHHV